MKQKMNFISYRKWSLNYDVIVSRYEEEILDKVISKLYPFFNYFYIKEEEVRNIDVTEHFVKTDKLMYNELRDEYGNPYNLYRKKLWDCLSNIECVEGSRAEKYLYKAFELINEGYWDRVAEAVIIYVSLLRNIKEEAYNQKIISVINDIIIDIDEEDIEYFESLQKKGINYQNIGKKKSSLLLDQAKTYSNVFTDAISYYLSNPSPHFLNKEEKDKYVNAIFYEYSILFLYKGFQELTYIQSIGDEGR